MTPREWTALGFRLFAVQLILITLIVAPTSFWSVFSYSKDLGYEFSPHGLVAFLPLVFSLIWGIVILRSTDWFVDKTFESVLARFDGDKRDDDDIDALSATSTNAVIAGRGTAIDSEVVANTDGVTEQVSEFEDRWILDFPKLKRDDVLAIALSITGVWILASALPELATQIVQFVFIDMRDESNNPLFDMFNLFVSGPTNATFWIVMRVIIGGFLFLRSYRIVGIWSRAQVRKRRVSILDPMYDSPDNTAD